MIKTKEDLKIFLHSDSKNFSTQNSGTWKKIKYNIYASPIRENDIIWKYIYNLRHLEYHLNNHGIIHKILKIWFFYRIRKLSHITGFQIPPNTIEKGLTIYHWGPIIINEKVHIGENCILNPMIVIGHKIKGEKAPTIGNNCFIGSGTKIIGDIIIEDNVKIGQNVVINKSIKKGTTIVCQQPRIIEF